MGLRVQDNDALVEKLWARKLMAEAMRTGDTSVPGWILARDRFPIDRQKIINMAADISSALCASVADVGLPEYVVAVLQSTTRFQERGFRSLSQLAALSDDQLKQLPMFGDAEVALIRDAVRVAVENADLYTMRNAGNLNRT